MKILELNPGILRVPSGRGKLPDVYDRIRKIVEEIRSYSVEDRFELGFEFCKEFCLDSKVLDFLIDHVDGAFISGILRGLRFVELRVKRRLNYLGYRFGKGKVLIVGDVGNKLGYEMEGGEIVVKGNAGNWVGERMRGGSIKVVGNVGNYLGFCMEGGRIVVEGNARYGVGDKMIGGEIFVKGNARNVGRDMRGGVIRVMGKVESFGYRGAGKVYYWKDGEWKERDVDYYIYYR